MTPYKGPASGTEQAPSLFPSDAAVLSDDAVAWVLAREAALPAKARLAVVRVGHRSEWFGWSDEFSRLEAERRGGLPDVP